MAKSKTIIFMLLLLSCTTSIAEKHQNQQQQESSKYINDWWNNVYELRIKQENYKEIRQQTTSKCEEKIGWYTKKVTERPNSEYFIHKLESWIEKCHKEIKDTPNMVLPTPTD